MMDTTSPNKMDMTTETMNTMNNTNMTNNTSNEDVEMNM